MTVSTARPAQAAKEKRSRGRPACSAIAGSDALLKSARQAFAKRGFDATSVREIAEQTAPMIESTAKLRSSDLSPRKRVERALAIFIDKVFSEPDIGMFFSTAATEQGERLDVLVERLLRPYHDAFVVLLADAMDAGELTRNDPEVLFAMLTNAVGKTVSYSHVLSIFSSLPQHEAKFKRTVLAAALSML